MGGLRPKLGDAPKIRGRPFTNSEPTPSNPCLKHHEALYENETEMEMSFSNLVQHSQLGDWWRPGFWLVMHACNISPGAGSGDRSWRCSLEIRSSLVGRCSSGDGSPCGLGPARNALSVWPGRPPTWVPPPPRFSTHPSSPAPPPTLFGTQLCKTPSSPSSLSLARGLATGWVGEWGSGVGASPGRKLFSSFPESRARGRPLARPGWVGADKVSGCW